MKQKQFYETPLAEVFRIQSEMFLCQSGGGDYSQDPGDPGNDLEEDDPFNL